MVLQKFYANEFYVIRRTIKDNFRQGLSKIADAIRFFASKTYRALEIFDFYNYKIGKMFSLRFACD